MPEESAVELYRALAQASFALLGLWWVVVQFRHAEWMAERPARRSAYGVSLNFLLPGVMSLMSLAAPEHEAIWRVSFGVAGAVGLLEAARRLAMPARPAERVALAALAVTYALVALIAIDDSLLRDIGIRLYALQGEGILVGFLVFVAVNLAWLAFAEPRHSA
jgi:hypothetical protein